MNSCLLLSFVIVFHSIGFSLAHSLSSVDSRDGNNNDDSNDFSDKKAVRHIHLAYGKDASTSMSISFSSTLLSTISFLEEEYDVKGGVLLGKSQLDLRDLNSKFYAASSNPETYNITYTNKQKNDAVEVYESDPIYHVAINHLDPNTVYYFQCVLFVSPTTLDDESKEHKTIDLDENSDVVSPDASIDYELADEGNFDFRINHRKRRILKPEAIKPYYSEIQTFQTSTPQTTSDSLKIAIIGDIGVTPNAFDCLSHLFQDIHSSKTDLRNSSKGSAPISSIVFLGDIAYSKNHPQKWDQWFDFVDKFVATTSSSEDNDAIYNQRQEIQQVPMMVIPGNHDIDHNYLGDGKIFSAYETRFQMPHAGKLLRDTVMYDNNSRIKLRKMMNLPYEFGNAFYSFHNGLTKNIVLSPFSNFQFGSKQYNWLLQELKNARLSGYPWILVYIHCPIYNTYTDHLNDPQVVHAKEVLEPLFADYQVNFVFSGHVHAYQRSKPILKQKTSSSSQDHQRGGTSYIILGNGGVEVGLAEYIDSQKQEDWVASRSNQVFGYGTLEIFNDTMARYEFVPTSYDEDYDELSSGKFVDAEYITNYYYV